MTWYNNNWNYRKPVTISYSGVALTDYQVLITVDTVSLITAVPTKMRSDCGDIRFVDTNDSTVLNYWIESVPSNSSATKIWIKIPSISSSKTIYMYYSNPSATYDNSAGGTSTFIVFEYFDTYTNGNAINTYANWSGNGSVTNTTSTSSPNSYYLPSGNPALNATRTIPTISNNITAEFGIRSSKPAQTYAYSWVSFQNGGSIAAGIGFGRQYSGQGSSIIYHTPDGTIIQSYSVNTWYNIRIDMKFDTKLATFYIDDMQTPKVTDAGFATALSSINNIYFHDYLVGEMWVDSIKIRKYSTTVPTVSISGSEETYVSPANITATNMSISPSESPCRTGICTVTIIVRWSNSGQADGLVTPNITIDTVSQTAHSPRNVVAGSYIDETFTLSGLSAGTHAICPNPN